MHVARSKVMVPDEPVHAIMPLLTHQPVFYRTRTTVLRLPVPLPLGAYQYHYHYDHSATTTTTV